MNGIRKPAARPVSTMTTTETAVDLQEQIRRRAYELYEQRGREEGRELDDWLQAEAEVMQATARAVAA